MTEELPKKDTGKMNGIYLSRSKSFVKLPDINLCISRSPSTGL
uniref:Uncharacterized protein n=1 Tax=Anguilla anguilla TaxID=7936 RepID=A0A0E9W9T1_ANGAN